MRGTTDGVFGRRAYSAVAALIAVSAVTFSGCGDGAAPAEFDTSGDVADDPGGAVDSEYPDVPGESGVDSFQDRLLSDGESDVAADAGDAAVDAGPDVSSPYWYEYAPAAVHVRFDPAKMSQDFFAVPFPTDMRLNADGVPDLSSFPNPSGSAMVEDIREMATYRRTGWHRTPACQFAFSGPVDVSGLPTDPFAFVDPESGIQIVDVTPDSARRGSRIPLIWHYWSDPDGIQPGSLLSVMPVPGHVLEPDSVYACLVTRGLKDESGESVGQSREFWKAMVGVGSGPAGEKVVSVHRPLADCMLETGFPASEIAGAAVFSTGHVMRTFKQLYDSVQTGFTGRFSQSGFAQTRTCPGFSVLEGAFEVPIFREGDEPYDQGGRFRFDAHGLPVEVRREEAPVVITLPDVPMPPDGYPIVIYIHGSNGTSLQAVDRGRTPEKGGVSTPCEGPAFELAKQGFAVAAMALPMNPQRYPEGGRDAYQNLGNFPSVIGHYQQAASELGLLLSAVEKLQMNMSGVSGYTGTEDTVKFDFSRGAMAMGQSQGGQTLSLWSAVEPGLRAIVPCGVGGIYTLVFFLVDEPPVGELLSFMLGIDNPDLDFLHPMITLIQMGLEHIDPVAAVRQVNRAPFENLRPKSVFHAAGYIDSDFPPDTIQAWVIGIGADLAGESVYPDLFDRVQKSGGKVLSYPVTGNRPDPDDPENPDAATTLVVVQYPEDGILSGHHVNFQLPEPKFQYRCFFDSYFRTGRATVFAPTDPSAGCPSISQ